MKQYRDQLKAFLITMSAILLSSCATICGPAQEFAELPKTADLLHPEEDLDSIVVYLDCAGIYSVRSLPDSWSTNIAAEGENYIITFTPFDSWNSRKTDFPLQSPEIGVRGRGQWSDCFNMTVKVNYRVGVSSLSRTFVMDSESGTGWRLTP